MSNLSESQGDGEAYVIVTGETSGKNFGLLILSLAGFCGLGALLFFLHAYSVFGTVACLTLLGMALVQLFGGVRTEWHFSASGIECRKRYLLSSKTRHIAVDDIAAVGVETTRPSQEAKPLFLMSTWWSILAALVALTAQKPAGEWPTVYRLAFKLQSGETIMIDQRQVREAFVETLAHVSRRMPRVTWPVVA